MGVTDKRCYNKGEETPSGWQNGGKMETEKCGCLCEYSTKDGHCKYGTVHSDYYSLYKHVTKGKLRIQLNSKFFHCK